MRMIYIFLIGALFGMGIVVSGMGNPAKVVNFFDVAGTWDPSLIFVMGGALAVTLPGYRLVFGRGRPLFGSGFLLPLGRQIDRRLIAGSATFGVGWGIAGFCPGGALPVLGAFDASVWVFTGALVAGILTAHLLPRALGRRAAA
ncbi:DUF6691 family protein [Jannaschia sp. CCS1]|uniref:DUF6691 family protein n=1 Tax=Jannaschia sp. (strain CCS1) TaxID=290400 RepID=UPI00006C007A|nr:DUF6691 family protein [Jannaschia sp. CCS1]ABD55734.1 protein of unknown function DUF395 YeeE/YedE [Jannaschia sp. CCS1]